MHVPYTAELPLSARNLAAFLCAIPEALILPPRLLPYARRVDTLPPVIRKMPLTLFGWLTGGWKMYALKLLEKLAFPFNGLARTLTFVTAPLALTLPDTALLPTSTRVGIPFRFKLPEVLLLPTRLRVRVPLA